MKKITLILLFSFSISNLISQVAFDNRNWVIGRYYGNLTRINISYSTTANCPVGMDIIKMVSDTLHLYIQDSTCWNPYWSTIFNMSTVLNVSNDSTLRYLNTVYGKLYSTDSLHLDFYVTGMIIYKYSYRMKKVKSYWIAASVNELKNIENNILIYPNPCSEKLFVKNIANAEIKKYSLLSIEGREINLKKISKEEFDVSDLPAGLYFLQLQTKEGVLTKKIVVSR